MCFVCCSERAAVYNTPEEHAAGAAGDMINCGLIIIIIIFLY